MCGSDGCVWMCIRVWGGVGLGGGESVQCTWCLGGLTKHNIQVALDRLALHSNISWSDTLDDLANIRTAEYTRILGMLVPIEQISNPRL